MGEEPDGDGPDDGDGETPRRPRTEIAFGELATIFKPYVLVGGLTWFQYAEVLKAPRGGKPLAKLPTLWATMMDTAPTNALSTLHDCFKEITMDPAVATWFRVPKDKGDWCLAMARRVQCAFGHLRSARLNSPIPGWYTKLMQAAQSGGRLPLAPRPATSSSSASTRPRP